MVGYAMSCNVIELWFYVFYWHSFTTGTFYRKTKLGTSTACLQIAEDSRWYVYVKVKLMVNEFICGKLILFTLVLSSASYKLKH